MAKPEGPCIANPAGAGAMGTHAINGEYLTAQFPNGTMDPTTPPVLLLGNSGEVIGLEFVGEECEARITYHRIVRSH